MVLLCPYREGIMSKNYEFIGIEYDLRYEKRAKESLMATLAKSFIFLTALICLESPDFENILEFSTLFQDF